MKTIRPRLAILVLGLLYLAAALSTVSCSLKLPPADYRSESRATHEPPRVEIGEPASPTREATPTMVPHAQPSPVAAKPTAAASSGPRQQSQPAASPDANALPQAVAGPPLSVVQVAARVRPAVAQILVKGSTPNLFEPVPASGVGSGAVFDRRGYIMTNNHVVEEVDEIIVTLPEREKSYNGRLVGRDPSTDLAVIQIEADNLPVVPMGDSDALQVGEPVVAIGNALGLEGGPTVTTGVVSALNRSIDEPTGATLHQLIQTDAAINPGNSGGPLVNLAAQLIGINTAVATGSSRAPAQGIGFAISINSAKPILEDLIAYGKVRRPYLGVELVTVTPGIARQNRLPVDHGVYVARTVRGGPAARAGIEPGDIITRIESDTVKSIADLRKVLSKLKIGQKVKVQVVRGSGQRTTEVTLAEMPAP